MSMTMPIPYPHAIADVKARVSASRSSFQAGMMVLPRARREAMYATYAFCREVDDIADDSPSPAIAAEGLEMWRGRIRDLFEKSVAPDTITSALLPAIKTFDLQQRDFQAIIDGMAMDAATIICAPPYAILDLYCDRVASAVGRISVHIFGDDSPNAVEAAHHLGRAFQLTNILRDLKEDADRGRLYLPEEFLTKNGIASRVPAEVLKDKNLHLACQDLAAKARAHFISSDLIMNLCNQKAMRPARIMRAYYGAILKRLSALDWKDPSTRVRLPKWQKLWLVVRHLVA